MSRSNTFLFSLAALLALPSALAAQRPVAERDVLKYRWIADPQISPDGKQVAYVLVTVNEKGDGYETSLWAVDAAGAAPPRRLTAGPRDFAPRWAPTSRTIAFLRAGEKEPPQLYLLPMAGGEGRKLTDLPKGASPAAWSPDGKSVAFTSETTQEDLAKRQKAGGKSAGAAVRDSIARRDSASRDPAAEDSAGRVLGTRASAGGDSATKSDVMVITRAEYRSNDQGWLDPTRHSHVWTAAVGADADGPATARQLTTGKFDEGELTWSRDGSRIYFTSVRVDEPYYAPPDANLYAVPAAGGAVTTVVDIDGPMSDAAASPDGKAFAFTGFVNPPQMQSFTQPELLLFRNGRAENLTAAYDFDIGGGLSADQHPPRGGSGSSPLIWAADGRSVIVAATERGRSNLVRIDVATHRVEPLTTGNHDVVAYTATPDASRMAVTIGDATHLGDVYLFVPATRKLTRLTRVSDEVLAGTTLSEPEEIWYTSFDGRKINAWVYKPANFSPRKKYPLIIDIHGGPHTAYGYTFFHEFQLMAARGYVVLAANPRGSSSYGQEFANVIQYRFPGDDYKDLMAGVDELLRRGYVDEKRLGVTGGSGGGILTNWTVTQTNRFAAAVAQRSIADWSAFYYTADFSLFTPFWFKKAPFEDPQEYAARSPITYASRITTPLMLIEGQADYRTPSGAGGEMMFRALKAQHKPTVMVVFPGETHELSRSGKPTHRVERLHHILAWFDKYLEGKDVAGYEVR